MRDPTPLSGVLISSLLLGGVPYVVCAALGLLSLWGRSLEEHRRLAKLSPVLFAPVLALSIGITGSLGRATWSFIEFGVLLAFSAAVAIPLGYLYLGLVLVLRRWVVGAGHVHHEEHAA